MINYTKKWWLLGCHGRAERLYSTRGSNDGNRVLISQSLFIDGYGEDKGLIHKSNAFARVRFSKLIFWKEEYSAEQLKVKRHTYNHIYEVCVREGYITKEKVKRIEYGKEIEVQYPTVSNPKAYNIRGFPFGFFNGLAKTYDKVTLAIVSITIAIIGSSYIANKLAKKDNTPPTPIINNFSTPDINPTINVYPTTNQ